MDRKLFSCMSGHDSPLLSKLVMVYCQASQPWQIIRYILSKETMEVDMALRFSMKLVIRHGRCRHALSLNA